MVDFFELAGAVALLLWGIRMVKTGFIRALGNRLERLLRRTTRTRPRAFGAGAGSAFVLQSSTAVVLMVSGFAASGMISLKAALGTVLGAELGASVAALVLNLNIRALAAPLLFVGYVFFITANSRRNKHTGRILMGLGMVLLSLTLLSGITGPLGESDLFAAVMETVARDSSLAIVLMALLTWLMHSTLAAILILSQFVLEGSMDFELALLLVLGANLGGGMPALIAGWSQAGPGRTVVAANLGFRGATVVLGLLLLWFARDPLLNHLPNGALGVPLFHFIINLLSGLLLLLVLPWIVRWLQANTRGPDAPLTIQDQSHQALYLSAKDQQHPDRALANARNEAQHIADIVYKMLNYTLDAFSDRQVADQISELDDDIDHLHREAMIYLVSVEEPKENGLKREIQLESGDIIDFMTNLEHIGDIIDASLMPLARTRVRQKLSFTPDQIRTLSRLHEQLVDAFRLSQAVFTSESEELARELLRSKREFRSRILAIRREHIATLNDDMRPSQARSVQSAQMFLDILRDLQRISSHSAFVAYQILGDHASDKDHPTTEL